MIIPVRCFTCGKVLGDKWNSYIEQVQKHYNNDVPEHNSMRVVDIQKNEESAEKKILDEMRIKRYCCRRVMLSTIDLVDKI